ncbi:MAG: hypothetical protein HN783_12320, partial [Ilumatobacter sp.]|nr:hypothetical protein [Ilumatobacter sp.]
EIIAAAGGGTVVPDLSAYVIGRQSPANAAQHFPGWLDEIRVWDNGRSQVQISATRVQILKGDETGLQAYWKLNEGDGALATDATDSNRTGQLRGDVAWTDDIPLNEDFVHYFEPEVRQVVLNPGNTTVDQVDFTDISQIAVSGFVKYSSTTCFIRNAEILVNGEVHVPPIRTDADGKFVVEFEPGATGQRLSVRFADHEITPAFIDLPRLTTPRTGLFFEDLVKRSASGQVVGGVCRVPITPTQGQISVELTTVDGCFEAAVIPDPQSGQWTAQDLPPLIYQARVEHPNPEIDAFFTGDTLSLVEDDGSRDFVYRAPPQVEVSGFPVNSCGLRVMNTFGGYDLDISVFETYLSSGDTLSCPADSGVVVIHDNLSATGEQQVDFVDGAALYSLTAGEPNIADGGAHPYQKNAQFTATDALNRNAAVEEWSYIQGAKPREADALATTTPEMPFIMLRDPPGDESFSYIEQGTTTSTALSFSFEADQQITTYATAHLGYESEEGGSFIAGAAVKTEIPFDVTATLSVNTRQASSFEQTWDFTANERFATEGRTREDIGADVGGDVYVGGALNILYGVSDHLSVDETTCQVSVAPEFIMVPQNFATTFIHSETFVTESVIPELEALGDTESADLWRSFIARNDQLKSEASFVRNITFDAGTLLESTETNESVTTASLDFQMEIETSVAAIAGLKVQGAGASGGVIVSARMGVGASTTVQQTTTTTTGFVLSDDDPGDNFSVDVLKDPVYGTPVFRLISGESQCPWEPG